MVRENNGNRLFSSLDFDISGDGEDHSASKAAEKLLSECGFHCRALEAAHENINKNLTKQPEGSPWSDVFVPRSKGCAAAMSNLLLKSQPDFGVENFEINVDGFEEMLRQEYSAAPINDVSTVSEGDFVIGRGAKDGGRHVGMIGEEQDGVRYVYHNASGKMVKEPLEKVFSDSRFSEIYALRVPEQ